MKKIFLLTSFFFSLVGLSQVVTSFDPSKIRAAIGLGTAATQNTSAFLAPQDAATTYLVKPLVTTSNGNSPTGTTSTTGVMAGLAKSITPQASGRILIVVSGQAQNGTGDQGFKYDLRYGTGTAPTNGSALTGTQVGSTVTGSSVASSTTTSVPIMPFIAHGVVTGLTPGTAYWIDLGQYAVGSGTASFSNINVSIIEL